MSGIEDRLAKINAIKAEAEAKKTAEKENAAKELAEKKAGLEQEKAQVEGELASATAELQKNETGLTEINAMDLSALDEESRAGIESEIIGIKEEMDNLRGKIDELTKRKQEIDETLKGMAGETEKMSDDKMVEASPEPATKEDPELTKLGASQKMRDAIHDIKFRNKYAGDLINWYSKARRSGNVNTDSVVKEGLERIAKIRQEPELVLQEVQEYAG
ncbi:MAG: hypothetical protein HZC05_01580 [Candidatus Magasanikbacteria bacterium]|nr:hypothetical protein [Candidatus Magasanikbacteria bacterium]